MQKYKPVEYPLEKEQFFSKRMFDEMLLFIYWLKETRNILSSWKVL